MATKSNEEEFNEEEISDSDIAKFQEELEKLDFKPLRETSRAKTKRDMAESDIRGNTKRLLTRRKTEEGKKVKDGF